MMPWRYRYSVPWAALRGVRGVRQSLRGRQVQMAGHPAGEPIAEESLCVRPFHGQGELLPLGFAEVSQYTRAPSLPQLPSLQLRRSSPGFDRRADRSEQTGRKGLTTTRDSTSARPGPGHLAPPRPGDPSEAAPASRVPKLRRPGHASSVGTGRRRGTRTCSRGRSRSSASPTRAAGSSWRPRTKASGSRCGSWGPRCRSPGPSPTWLGPRSSAPRTSPRRSSTGPSLGGRGGHGTTRRGNRDPGQRASEDSFHRRRVAGGGGSTAAGVASSDARRPAHLLQGEESMMGWSNQGSLTPVGPVHLPAGCNEA